MVDRIRQIDRSHKSWYSKTAKKLLNQKNCTKKNRRRKLIKRDKKIETEFKNVMTGRKDAWAIYWTRKIRSGSCYTRNKVQWSKKNTKEKLNRMISRDRKAKTRRHSFYGEGAVKTTSNKLQRETWQNIIYSEKIIKYKCIWARDDNKIPI